MEKCLTIKYCYAIVSRSIDAKRNGCDKISDFFRTLQPEPLQTKTISITTWCQEWDREMWKEKRTFNYNEVYATLNAHEIRIEERSNIRICICICICISNRSSNKWSSKRQWMCPTLWPLQHDLMKGNEEESTRKKNKHIQASTVGKRNREREWEREVIIHLNSIAAQHIPQSYQFTYSHSLFVLLCMWCWRQNTVSQPVCIRMWMLFVILQPSNGRLARVWRHTI